MNPLVADNHTTTTGVLEYMHSSNEAIHNIHLLLLTASNTHKKFVGNVSRQKTLLQDAANEPEIFNR